MAKLLIVDDDPAVLDVLTRALTIAGHDVMRAASGTEALAASERGAVDLALLDQKMAGLTGIETFQALRARLPNLPGIIITGYGTVEDCATSFKAGIADYVRKPLNLRELVDAVDRTLHDARVLPGSVATTKSTGEFAGMIGASPPMLRLFEQIRRAAGLREHVLITGETGTGKELVARALHDESSQRSGPFVAVNCPAVPSTLFESELFGHERGAFTDAREARPGRFEQAHHGTLFLDEIGDLPLEMQAKLLRVLDRPEVWRVGGTSARQVDVRVVTATNAPLKKLIAAGRFREDLYYRLAALELRVPALRDRGDDVQRLITHFAREASRGPGVIGRIFGRATIELLIQHDWPGNVRELQHLIIQAFLTASGTMVGPSDLTMNVSRTSFLVQSNERETLLAALERHNWSRHATAAALGMNVRTLFTKMRRLRILDPPTREDA